MQEGRSESPEDVSQEAKRPKLKTPDREKGEDGSNDREDDAKDEGFGRKTSEIANAKSLDESEEYGRVTGDDHATDRMDVDESGGDSGVEKKGCEEKSKEEQSHKTENETIMWNPRESRWKQQQGMLSRCRGKRKGRVGSRGRKMKRTGRAMKRLEEGGSEVARRARGVHAARLARWRSLCRQVFWSVSTPRRRGRRAL